MTDIPPGGPLSKEETETLAHLLARYMWYHVDQWEFWKADMPGMSYYAWIAMGCPDWEEGKSLDDIDWRQYATIWPRPNASEASDDDTPTPEGV